MSEHSHPPCSCFLKKTSFCLSPCVQWGSIPYPHHPRHHDHKRLFTRQEYTRLWASWLINARQKEKREGKKVAFRFSARCWLSGTWKGPSHSELRERTSPLFLYPHILLHLRTLGLVKGKRGSCVLAVHRFPAVCCSHILKAIKKYFTRWWGFHWARLRWHTSDPSKQLNQVLGLWLQYSTCLLWY